jgi:hypothetical protein
VLRATEGIVEIGRFGSAESVWKRTDSVWVPCKRAGAVERHRRGPLPRTPEALRYTLPAVSFQAFVSTTKLTIGRRIGEFWLLIAKDPSGSVCSEQPRTTMVELEWLTKGQDEDIPQPRGRSGSNGINAAAAELRRWTAALQLFSLRLWKMHLASARLYPTRSRGLRRLGYASFGKAARTTEVYKAPRRPDAKRPLVPEELS